MALNNEMIKFAVVGCGHIGKRHAVMIDRNPEAELVGLVDIANREDLGLDGLSAPLFKDMDALFDSEIDVDVLNICTANGLHAQHSLKALENNKHVVVEKPLGLNTANCKEVIAKANDVSKHVFCVMQNRYSPPSLWMKDVVEKDLLGEIYIVQINCYWNRDDKYYKKGGWKGTIEMDGGALFTQFSHFIDMMYWLFGDITDIKTQFDNFKHKSSTEFEDAGFVNFRFLNGGMGCFNYSTAVWGGNMESSITVIGSKGSVKLGGQYMERVEYCHIDGYDEPKFPSPSTKHNYGDYKGSANNHNFVMENVIDTLKGKTEVSLSGDDGLKVVDIIERIYSYR